MELPPYKMQVYRLKLVKSHKKSVKAEKIYGPETVAEALSTFLKGEDREHFVVLMLDVRKRIIGIHTVSIGSLNQTVVHPREVFKAAILANAHAIILGHNHPSGDSTPSIDDLDITRDLVRAGEDLKIPVLDHVIIGEDGKFTSLLAEGFIKSSREGGAYRLDLTSKETEEGVQKKSAVKKIKKTISFKKPKNGK